MRYFIQLRLFTTFCRCEAYLFAPILTGLQPDRADVPFNQSMASTTRSGGSAARGTPMVDSPGGRICVGGERSRMDTELRVFVRVVVFNAPEEIVTLFGPIKKILRKRVGSLTCKRLYQDIRHTKPRGHLRDLKNWHPRSHVIDD